jgi:hypothetical protein
MRAWTLLFLLACKSGSARLFSGETETGDGGADTGEPSGESGGEGGESGEEGGESGEEGGESGDDGDDGTDPGEGYGIFGTWYRHVPGVGGILFEINDDDGMYYASFADDPSEIVVKGEYTLDGDSIHIQDTWGPLSCEPEAEYRYEVGAEEMEFWTIEDPCSERNEVLDGTWDRRD